MAFPVSPSVVVREFDLTTIIPAVSLTPAAFAGVFRWGPIEQRVLVDNEITLTARFGKPTNLNPETFFTAANYLAYGGQLYIARAADVTGNVVSTSFDGNSTNLALQSGNTTAKITSTTGLNVGMKLLYSSNNAGLNPTSNGGVTISSVINATAIALSTPATANTEDVSFVWRDDITYTAIAQEVVDYTIDWDGQIVKNEHEYLNRDGLFDISALYVARYPGEMGSSLRVAVCDTADQYYSNTSLYPNAYFANTNNLAAIVGSNTITLTVAPANTANATQVTSANTLAGAAAASLTVGDLIELGNNTIGYQFIKVANVGVVTSLNNVFSFSVSMEDEFKLAANVALDSLERYWEFFNVVDSAPGQSSYVTGHGNTAANDELHVVVVDEGGAFTGSPQTVLEVHRSLSRATDAMGVEGGTIYYKEVINQNSGYVWFANDRSTARSNKASLIHSSTAAAPLNIRFYGGADGLGEANVALSQIIFAYDQFASAEDVDIGLILTGKARGLAVSSNTQLATYLINNIAETRKDCVVFCSPDKALVVNNKGQEAQDVVDARNVMPSTSYGFMDSGYKYQYDKYNDVYRWIPLNGDIAGLATRTDTTNDPWWSFAGFNRGQIKDVVKLAWNPRQSERDTLYKGGVNPVVTFPGQGTILFGDKTLLAKPSAFDRINVRRLFIVLEKAISTAAKYTLFEFNDEFTRSQFKAMVNPYLKDIQGRRGIQDFLVVCDGTNNTAEVIDNNQFKAAMYIKPARSINWVILDFVAVRTGVAFSEVVGKYGG